MPGGIVNIHERIYDAAPEKIGRFLDSLASSADALWPHSRWPAMRLDRPLGIGAAGGHGPIRYTVTEYEPGRSVRFRFTAPEGFRGSHRFEIEPAAPGKTRLRHVIEMQTSGAAAVTWPLLIRPLHDALLEDALDLVEANLGRNPPVRTHSLWVRILRRRMRRRTRRRVSCPDRKRP